MEFGGKTILKIDEHLFEQEITILSCAKAKGEIRNKDVQTLLGIKSSRAREIMSKLVEKKYLVYKK